MGDGDDLGYGGVISCIDGVKQRAGRYFDVSNRGHHGAGRE